MFTHHGKDHIIKVNIKTPAWNTTYDREEEDGVAYGRRSYNAFPL